MGDLFDDGDPFEDPTWQRAELMSGAAPYPARGYITCPLAWLARVLPVVRGGDQVVVALLLYRQCLLRCSRTVDLTNRNVAQVGVSRQTKYRTLTALEEAGAVTIQARNGRSVRVTLHWFHRCPSGGHPSASLIREERKEGRKNKKTRSVGVVGSETVRKR